MTITIMTVSDLHCVNKKKQIKMQLHCSKWCRFFKYCYQRNDNLICSPSLIHRSSVLKHGVTYGVIFWGHNFHICNLKSTEKRKSHFISLKIFTQISSPVCVHHPVCVHLTYTKTIIKMKSHYHQYFNVQIDKSSVHPHIWSTCGRNLDFVDAN